MSDLPDLLDRLFSKKEGPRRVTLREIADSLDSADATIAVDGYYQNRHGIWGYYATVHSDDHWYMVGVPHVRQPVKLEEIAYDLRLTGTQVVQEGNYQNRHGVPGYYVTVDCWGDHWYMISISNMSPPDIRDFEWPPWEDQGC